MMRRFLIYLSKARWAQRTIPRLWFVRRAARHFVAGETPEEAIKAIQALNKCGILATLDHLGENTSNAEESLDATETILADLDDINQARLRANVSVKLTQIGLTINKTLCESNLKRILEKARFYGNFVRIDMEESTTTDRILELYSQMRDMGMKNLGVVLQAYLYRSDSDLSNLIKRGAKVRLVKGAYREPSSLAYPRKADVDAHFDNLTRRLIDGALTYKADPVSIDGRIPPMAAIATHDEARIDFARSYASQVGLPNSALEFQMLYGIRRDLQESLVTAGHPVRVYVPYGTAWYPYLMRRMAERPANLWFFARHIIKQ